MKTALILILKAVNLDLVLQQFVNVTPTSVR